MATEASPTPHTAWEPKHAAALDQCQAEIKAAMTKALAAGVEGGEIVTLMTGYLGTVASNLSIGKAGELIRLIVGEMQRRAGDNIGRG